VIHFASHHMYVLSVAQARVILGVNREKRVADVDADDADGRMVGTA